MGNALFGALDLGLAFAVVLGIGLWQLIAVRRSIRRHRERSDDGPEDGAGDVTFEKERRVCCNRRPLR